MTCLVPGDKAQRSRKCGPDLGGDFAWEDAIVRWAERMSALLRKRRFVWLLALVLVVGLAVAGYFSGRRYLDAAEWVTHTFEVSEAIDRVVTGVHEVESGQRGYLLSGDEAFLEAYYQARAALPEELEHLRSLPRDNRPQLERVSRLEQAVLAKVAFAEATVAIKRHGGDFTGLVASGRGRLLMDEIRVLAADMRRVEQQLLALRTERAAGAQSQTVLMSLFAVALMLGLALFSLATAQTDLQELRAMAEDLVVAERMFRGLAENTAELVALLDTKGKVSYVSPSCQRLLGYSPEEFRQLDPSSLVETGDLAGVRNRLRGVLTGDTQLDVMNLRYRTKSGQLRWFEVHATVLREGATSAPSILLSARDVHERRLAQEALEQKTGELETLSTTDALTGLLNRRAFMERGRELLEGARATGRGLAIVFIDLDGLKPLNDRLGHEAGDRALNDTSVVLRQTCRGGDLVARLGGDEFVVLARDLTPDGYVRFRLRLDAALLTFNAAPGRPFGLSFSLGAAFLEPGSDESIEALVQRADAEMYEEKRARRLGRS